MIQRLQSSTAKNWVAPPTDPVVLCAADDHYIKPLAVTLRSAAMALKPDCHLQVILLDGGICESNFATLMESLLGLPISINAMTIDRSEVSDLGISHHITHTAYFRLLAGRLLPPSVDKVIYLDSDVLVQGDLTELWNLPLDDQYCLAANDIACPFIDAYEALKRHPEIKNSIPFYAAISPVANWRQLGIDGSQHYFNSGVMVLNINRWRREAIDQKLLTCLRENSTFVWCWDQYALNVVFAGQWGPLPQRWNQGAHIFEYPDADSSPLSQAEFDQVKNDPALIHFTTEFKPWKHEPFHPLRHRFFEALDQTAWAGWRPEKPAFSLKRSWDLLAVALIKIGTNSYRKLQLRFR